MTQLTIEDFVRVWRRNKRPRHRFEDNVPLKIWVPGIPIWICGVVHFEYSKNAYVFEIGVIDSDGEFKGRYLETETLAVWLIRRYVRRHLCVGHVVGLRDNRPDQRSPAIKKVLAIKTL